MKKFILFTFFILQFNFVYAQPVPPQAEVYNEVYNIADCLNAYEGTTCIIIGNITLLDDSTAHHHDRYLIKDSTGEISGNFSHHVIGNNKNITIGTYKIIGEIRGVNHHPDMHRAPKHHLDPHLAVRYIEKQ